MNPLYLVDRIPCVLRQISAVCSGKVVLPQNLGFMVAGEATCYNKFQRMAGTAPLPRLLVVAGPSGVGKGTLLKRLQERFPNAFGFSVSYTSRQQRPGEQHGVHYMFVDKPTFENGITENLFIEYTKTYGNYYGTAASEVERVQKRGQICLLEVDLEGVKQIRKSPIGPLCHYIFISPPSLEALEARLKRRSTETPSEIATRLDFARKELDQAKELSFDYVLVNDHFNNCYTALEKAVCAMYSSLKLSATNTNGHQFPLSSDNAPCNV